jgi:hypothetical protein
MARRKPKVPFASAVVPPVRLDPSDWSRIEREYGHALPSGLREKILRHTQFFVDMAIHENAAQPIETAVKRLKHLRRSAQDLLELLYQAQSLLDLPDIYADELVVWHLYQKVPHPSRTHEFLFPFANEVRSFEKACASAQDEMTRDSNQKPGYWRAGWAWDEWIKNLTTTLTEHQLPISVRKDSDKNRTPSPFARFVIELQKSVPRQCRHYSTTDAISQGIVRARRVTKPEPSPTQMSR